MVGLSAKTGLSALCLQAAYFDSSAELRTDRLRENLQHVDASHITYTNAIIGGISEVHYTLGITQSIICQKDRRFWLSA